MKIDSLKTTSELSESQFFVIHANPEEALCSVRGEADGATYVDLVEDALRRLLECDRAGATQ
jgi:hypothetical protein